MEPPNTCTQQPITAGSVDWSTAVCTSSHQCPCYFSPYIELYACHSECAHPPCLTMLLARGECRRSERATTPCRAVSTISCWHPPSRCHDLSEALRCPCCNPPKPRRRIGSWKFASQTRDDGRWLWGACCTANTQAATPQVRYVLRIANEHCLRPRPVAYFILGSLPYEASERGRATSVDIRQRLIRTRRYAGRCSGCCSGREHGC